MHLSSPLYHPSTYSEVLPSCRRGLHRSDLFIIELGLICEMRQFDSLKTLEVVHTNRRSVLYVLRTFFTAKTGRSSEGFYNNSAVTFSFRSTFVQPQAKYYSTNLWTPLISLSTPNLTAQTSHFHLRINDYLRIDERFANTLAEKRATFSSTVATGNTWSISLDIQS